jgi:hypothetical protein
MNESTHMTRYLLGELSEDEQAALEEQYVGDPRIFDEVARAESDLVDDYVRGKLAPEARARFERVYLAHPQRRKRLKFAEALVTRLDQMERPVSVDAAPSASVGFDWRTWLDQLGPKPVLGLAFATLLLVSGVWLVFEARRTRQEAVQRESARTDQERQNREADARAAAEKARAEQAAAARPPTVVVLALSVGPGARAVDTSSPTPLVIPAGTSEVRLQLSMQPLDYASYRVILRSVGAAEILRRGELTPAAAGSHADITLTVSANAFESGDYMLTLQGARSGGGFEDLSRSLIRVDRR